MQTRILTALTAFAAGINGHIIMKSPAPFGSVGSTKSITSSPLTSANFPCQVGSDPAKFYSKDGLDNKMVIGQPQKLSFEGSAVHGGGSCQLALTKDTQPSASTSWQVILSIEGGCPSKSGTGTDEYDFTVPDSIEPGDYVFAWTWISKLSGTQEYYMNCAPVTITGGSGKREVSHNETMELFGRDDSALPELMVANLADINDCKSELSTDPEFPVPGPNVIKPGSNNKFAPISGSNCVPKGVKAVPSDGGSPSVPAQTSAIASDTDVPSTFVTLTIDTSTLPAPTATTSSAAVTTSSSAVHTRTATASPSPSHASSAPAGPSGSPTPGSGSAQGLTGPCKTEGMFNCIGGTSYQQCASGSWSVVMKMPPTTKCKEGQTMTLWGRGLSPQRDSLMGRRRGY
ncbi:hypothetical protein F5B22DRAFT_480183 [Xylaria bambusicola]|uniref:uncharacterized protein n=1 Tax=Xylaria bambusicola TaxID=326684 RepID=UPI0020086E5D|nr:uncharacterized protein F5B22DRAFT_480183 [Xylaria bambusicola]KAI0506140.1 hypothetical protein F5B22DRAFT_480183 [Xylaria bambusicola]